VQSHEHYEGLCAAAVSGQIRPDELPVLKEHMQTCAECRHFIGDVGAIVAEAVPELMRRSTPQAKKPAGMVERFVARARSESIPLMMSGKRSGIKRSTKLGYAVLASAAAILVVVLSYRYLKTYQRISAPERRTIEVTDASSTASRHADPELQEEIATLRSQVDSLKAKLGADQVALRTTTDQKGELASQVEEAQRKNDGLEKTLADRDAQTQQLEEKLAKIDADSKAGQAVAEVEGVELNKLREQVETLNAKLRESEELSAAANQAKDLIVARNLHIVDVHDADERGNRKRAFGRIFYTEGESLIFYAYDLADSNKLNAKIKFCVWGERLGATGQPVKTLGIFQPDNENDGRWVLTFNNRGVLAQIDAVFVTVESDKHAVTGPTGKKILYAYLGSKPNHP